MSERDGNNRLISRPRASVGTLVNLGILVVMVVTGGVGFMNYLGEMQRNLAILQNQMLSAQTQMTGMQAQIASMQTQLSDLSRQLSAVMANTERAK